jgi:hypothetical protein
MSEYPKAIKRLLRQWATEAYENELRIELTKLDRSFTEWRNGGISSGELSYRIHQYETHPSREMFNRYNNGDDANNVAYAIVAGLIKREEVSSEVLAAIEGPLDFYQSLKGRGELRMPGEEK